MTPENVRIGRKCLEGTNTLAFYSKMQLIFEAFIKRCSLSVTEKNMDKTHLSNITPYMKMLD
jgi:hypothetical protein